MSLLYQDTQQKTELLTSKTKRMKIRVYARKFALLAAMLFCTAAAMAQVSVTGVVQDASGEPVIGASILVVGTTNGTITDIDGNFAISVADGATLKVTYVGYKDEQVVVNGQNHLVITLNEDAEMLDDVVVVGYGVVKKDDATGSVTAIKPDDINKGLVTNAQDMLQGKIAGVNITNSGGAPGSGATIRIRGGSSLSASNDPLIVIDGLAMDNNGIQGVSNPLSMVNPNDIETLTVLKDASATAIYGSRASNGVIIITTKKGKAGAAPKFSYEGNVSLGSLVSRLETLTGDELREYAVLRNHSAKKRSTLGTENTDWQDAIYRQAPGTDHNFSLTGGTKHMPYRASLGYTYQDGTIKTSNMQRVTAAINLNPSFLDNHLSFNLNAKGMYIYNRYADGGVVGAALSMDPTHGVYDSTYPEYLFGGYWQQGVKATTGYNDPKWGFLPNQQTTANPLATLEGKDSHAHSGAFVGNIEADYKIHGFEDLRLHANFGADYSYGKQLTTIQPWSYSNHYYGWIGWEDKMKYNLSFNAYAQYYKDFNERHHFDIMAGYEWQHFYNTYHSEGAGYYRSTNSDPNLAGKPYANSVYDHTTATESYLVSFFGRLNYIALNRYMITATVRGDGSSRFAPKHRWGVFPSVALGWKIKEEAFLRDVYWLSDLKLRLGYGITGQQDINQGDYPYMANYIENQAHAYYPAITDEEGNPYITYRPDAYNELLTWEKTTTYNAGIDFGFLRSRITGSIDYYYRQTNDLINVVDIPAATNFKNRLVSNIGSLYNQGVEVSLNAVAIDTKSLKWDIGVNLAWNENKITSLTAAENENYYVATGGISSGTGNNIQAHKVGYAASSFYVYETTTEAVDANGNPTFRIGDGNYYFVDRNGDGKLTADDRYIYHSPAPDVTMGITSKWLFHGFDLSFSLRASIGNYVYNDVLANNLQWVDNVYSDQNGGYHGLLRECYDFRWNNGFVADGEWYMSDVFIENASFLRCDNITFGYTFDRPKIKARIYATVQNPFVITKYSGLDPEISGGIDNNIYPRSMTSIVGVSLQF